MISKKALILFLLPAMFGLLTVACTAQQTEEQALESLRQMTRDGKLPSESVVEQIERRFSGKPTGVLARLLRARIKFESKDFAGAASLLDSNDFATKTKLGDHALWLRGQALQASGNHPAAIVVLAKLEQDFPDSVRAKDARLLRAESSIAAGRAKDVPPMLTELLEDTVLDPKVFILMARAYDAEGSKEESAKNYGWAYAFTSNPELRKEIESRIAALGFAVSVNAHITATFVEYGDMLRLADGYLQSRDHGKAAAAYDELARKYPNGIRSETQIDRLTAYLNTNRLAEAPRILAELSGSPRELEDAFHKVIAAYAKVKMWPQARQYAEEMRQKFPYGKLTPKAWVDAGLAARDARNKGEEQFFLGAALANYPNAVEVAQAQFELAWLAHEAGDFTRSSQMLIEHLARYVDRDTTNRGKAGYWAARDSERAGKADDACILYDAVVYRYSANWYGYQAEQRLAAMRSQGKCGGRDGNGIKQLSTSHSLLAKAETNLKTVTVAPETAGPAELNRAEKSLELSTVGLFDWSLDELNAARKTVPTSPSINLALARHHRNKGDNVSALLALAKSYPDYSQMFPEEMGQEEWDIFYPHVAWDQITAWAKHRKLDVYQVAGLIRQESVFNPRAKSHANAYGLMQLLIPTARATARKYGSTAMITAESLFQPALNIELGTAYMRDQLDKFGRIEFMAVAYNAGPGRVPQWRATLPAEMDEFVEAIPFRETKGYVQGVIRNSAQYRRLYDEKGNFKPHVGSRPVRAVIDTATRAELAADFPDLVLSADSPGGE